jgi:ketosteroid isomerase-like protein
MPVSAAENKEIVQDFNWFFTLRDGKIVNMREYMDTGHVNDVLPLPPI